jgi:hypothetical protein
MFGPGGLPVGASDRAGGVSGSVNLFCARVLICWWKGLSSFLYPRLPSGRE